MAACPSARRRAGKRPPSPPHRLLGACCFAFELIRLGLICRSKLPSSADFADDGCGFRGLMMRRRMFYCRFVAVLALLMGLPAGVVALDFRRDVLPVLENRCFECHRGEDASSGVRLDLRDELLGETTGRVLVAPGDPDRSRLILVISGRDPEIKMPPEGDRLPDREIAVLRAWIKEGMAWDDKLLPPPPLVSEHWAFQKVERPALPATALADADHPIDAFTAARLHGARLGIAPEADRRTLARRLYFDLIGLPPSKDEVDAFAADGRPDAYQRLVDRLLASPHYGQRWGRHWLDVARWAETEGFESNHPRPFAWRYRDYVVDSFNRDRPFDQFVTQQIAGDELIPCTDENLIATGFLAAARISSNEEDKWLQRNDVNVDIVNAIGSGLLGLSLHCAQCHNHKFDPVTAADYYRLQAFFVRGQPVNVRLKDGEGDAQATRNYEAAVVLRDSLLEAGRQKFIEQERTKLSDTQRAALAIPLPQRTVEQELIARKAALRFERTAGEYEKHIPEADRALYNELKKRVTDQERQLAVPPQTFAFYSPVQSPHPATLLPSLGFYPLPFDPQFFAQVQPYVMVRGNVHSIGRKVQPTWPAVLGGAAGPERELRRTDLAAWLTNRSNPLVARVWVNRLWHYHFGRGIVATTDDFGTKGATPTHPELLDWLAAELVDSDWSTKHIHRLIVTSRTYRQTARVSQKVIAADPENRLWTRWLPRRLESEALRDAMLQVAGDLDERSGGPSVTLGNSETSRRRSLYLFQKRGEANPLQALFDGPNECSASCGERLVSTSPLQALYLLNGDFAVDRARSLAQSLADRCGGDREELIAESFRQVLLRLPSNDECLAAEKLFADRDTNSALMLLCQSLLNLNEFVYLE